MTQTQFLRSYILHKSLTYYLLKLHAFINRNLLPTNIELETAISYEMYYGQNERVELYRDDKKIDEKLLIQPEKIKEKKLFYSKENQELGK